MAVVPQVISPVILLPKVTSLRPRPITRSRKANSNHQQDEDVEEALQEQQAEALQGKVRFTMHRTSYRELLLD